jgi:hypothetical protein
MNTRTFALVFGILFLLVGAAGFLPGVTLMPPYSHPDVHIQKLFGYELGLFPVNILHSLVHLAFGVWGLFVYRSLAGAKFYAKGVAVIYAVLTVMGLIPALQTTFGFIPLFGHDVWLHALLAGVAAYFGFVHRDAGTGDPA